MNVEDQVFADQMNDVTTLLDHTDVCLLLPIVIVAIKELDNVA